jgi:hypothetical protein
MAEHRAAVAGTLGPTADPGAPDDPTPPPPTVRGLAVRLAFWVLICVGGIYTLTTESWRHDGVLSIRAAFWAVIMLNAIWQAWRRFEELRQLQSHRNALPH